MSCLRLSSLHCTAFLLSEFLRRIVPRSSNVVGLEFFGDLLETGRQGREAKIPG